MPNLYTSEEQRQWRTMSSSNDDDADNCGGGGGDGVTQLKFDPQQYHNMKCQEMATSALSSEEEWQRLKNQMRGNRLTTSTAILHHMHDTVQQRVKDEKNNSGSNSNNRNKKNKNKRQPYLRSQSTLNLSGSTANLTAFRDTAASNNVINSDGKCATCGLRPRKAIERASSTFCRCAGSRSLADDEHQLLGTVSNHETSSSRRESLVTLAAINTMFNKKEAAVPGGELLCEFGDRRACSAGRAGRAGLLQRSESLPNPEQRQVSWLDRFSLTRPAAAVDYNYNDGAASVSSTAPPLTASTRSSVSSIGTNYSISSMISSLSSSSSSSSPSSSNNNVVDESTQPKEAKGEQESTNNTTTTTNNNNKSSSSSNSPSLEMSLGSFFKYATSTEQQKMLQDETIDAKQRQTRRKKSSSNNSSSGGSRCSNKSSRSRSSTASRRRKKKNASSSSSSTRATTPPPKYFSDDLLCDFGDPPFAQQEQQQIAAEGLSLNLLLAN